MFLILLSLLIIIVHAVPICDLIAATDWGKYNDGSNNDWQCDANGTTYSDPCDNWTITVNTITYTPIKCTANEVTNLNIVGTGYGTLPTSIGNLTALTKLTIQNSALNSTIPTTIGSLTSLISFRIFSAGFSGTIPSSIGALTDLEVLQWNYNKLNGTIPPELGSLHQLNRLSLTSNNLNGALPSTLCTAATSSVLSSLDVTSNVDLTCYPQCLSAVALFPKGYVVTNSDGHQVVFGVCGDGSGEAPPLFNYSLVYLVCAVGLAAIACCCGASIQPPADQSIHHHNSSNKQHNSWRLYNNIPWYWQLIDVFKSIILCLCCSWYYICPLYGRNKGDRRDGQNSINPTGCCGWSWSWQQQWEVEHHDLHRHKNMKETLQALRQDASSSSSSSSRDMELATMRSKKTQSSIGASMVYSSVEGGAKPQYGQVKQKNPRTVMNSFFPPETAATATATEADAETAVP